MIRVILLSVLFLVNIQASEKLKLGVLTYGTVNWELDVIKHHKLDFKNGFDLEIVKLASKNASTIAFQGKSVDMIVNDWLWVNTQRANEKDFTFYPYSKATGTLYVSKTNKAKNFLDLKGQNIGVAGGPVDKTWLILRAYSKYKYNIDLKNIIKPTFASPPILFKKVLDKSLDGAINFWHFNAKAKAKGARALVSMDEVLKDLGIKEDIPLIGWTFRKDMANKNKKLYNSFIKASHEAKDILLSSQKEWERIKPLMKTKDNKTFEALRDGYRQGAIKEFNDSTFKASTKVFEILLKEGGKKLVGKSKSLQKDTFWEYEK
jgi:NitT/TauT family transport system substrate-binding protein